MEDFSHMSNDELYNLMESINKEINRRNTARFNELASDFATAILRLNTEFPNVTFYINTEAEDDDGELDLFSAIPMNKKQIMDMIEI